MAIWVFSLRFCCVCWLAINTILNNLLQKTTIMAHRFHHNATTCFRSKVYISLHFTYLTFFVTLLECSATQATTTFLTCVTAFSTTVVNFTDFLRKFFYTSLWVMSCTTTLIPRLTTISTTTFVTSATTSTSAWYQTWLWKYSTWAIITHCFNYQQHKKQSNNKHFHFYGWILWRLYTVVHALFFKFVWKIRKTGWDLRSKITRKLRAVVFHPFKIDCSTSTKKFPTTTPTNKPIHRHQHQH